MTAIAPLLLALGRAGIELVPNPTDASRLRHRPVLLAPDLAARLRLHKADLLAVLRGDGLPDESDAEAGYIVAERLGVADGLGMPTHPGSAAWLVAIGEGLNSSCLMAMDTVH